MGAAAAALYLVLRWHFVLADTFRSRLSLSRRRQGEELGSDLRNIGLRKADGTPRRC